jgi:hypothetical protein
MKIALPVMPLECIAHRTKPAPLKPKGAAPRLSPSANCRSGMLVQCAPLKKKKTSLRHPPEGSSVGWLAILARLLYRDERCCHRDGSV